MGTIAVATNFTERADRALRRAALIARESGDELLVVHVLEESDEEREGADAKLNAISRSLQDLDGIRSTADIREGEVAQQICEAAARANAYLVMLGAHRGELRDVVQNTTAEKLARDCPLPVLAANCFASRQYKGALLATDLSEENLRCADKFDALPLLPSDRATVIHVFDPEALTMLGRAFVSGDDRSAYLHSRKSEAYADLRNWAAKGGLPFAGIQVRASVGSVPDDILRAAQEQSADLIVVCNRKDGAAKRAVVGSVTGTLLRNVEVDVLVIPPAE